jgi:integrase/recombinase XerD
MSYTGKYSDLKREFGGMLKPFGAYLEKQGYEANTIRQFKNYTAYFLNWQKRQKPGEASYNDLLVYIDDCREQGDSTKLTNRKLAAIRKYYDYLQSKGEAVKNPASGLFLKGKRSSVPNNLLDKKELQELYNNYQPYDLRTTRNKVILSLLINQAVTTDELHKLEPGHLKLKSGKIEIPGGKHSNGRVLELAANQIIELQEYLNETRPAILKAIRKTPKWSGRKAAKPDFKRLENQLIISVNGSTSIKNSQHHLIKALQQINPKVRSCGQIRQSVIAEWLKTEDVRNVQYKAGHRYVSTTERYQTNNLEDLQEALNIHHPLNNY